MLTLRARCLGGALLMATLPIACEGGGTRSLEWSYRFAIPDSRSAAVMIEARILRGGCEAVDAQYNASFGVGVEGTALPPLLGRGRWGFDLRALDSGCRVIASGCVAVELPDEGLDGVLVVLEPDTSGASACPTTVCAAGVCGDFDAGRPDSGSVVDRDGGPVDAGGSPCGACSPPNATGVCVGDRCAIETCSTAHRDCDDNVVTGCEATCPDVPNIEPACFADRGCVANRCRLGFSDCDGVAENGCEHEGVCQCPAGGDCIFDCPNGCAVSCDRSCEVHCGRCTRCEVSCARGVLCTVYCAPGVAVTVGSTVSAVSTDCTVAETCLGAP